MATEESSVVRWCATSIEIAEKTPHLVSPKRITAAIKLLQNCLSNGDLQPEEHKSLTDRAFDALHKVSKAYHERFPK